MKYSDLVDLYVKLEGTSKRLEKTFLISSFLKKCSESDLEMIGLLLRGRVFPSWDETSLGFASKLAVKAISLATGVSAEKIEQHWKKTGDLGKTAKELIGAHKQKSLLSQDITVKKVFDNLRKLPFLEGKGAVEKKVQLVAELLVSATPDEARFIIRSSLEDLRLGIGESTFRDAVVCAYLYDPQFDLAKGEINPESREEYTKCVEDVQSAYDILNDFGKVMVLAKEKRLHTAKVEPGRAIKVMLYQKAINMENAFERVGTPCALEFKYDGFRVQVHKKDGVLRLFTRRLDEVTAQFPDVIEYFTKYVDADSYILDAEVVGYDKNTKKYLPFQSISQRIKRKYDIEKTSEEFPVEANVFDILYLDGETLFSAPFLTRRKHLEKIVKSHAYKIRTSEIIITKDIHEANEFYKRALAAGEEGVMAKNLEGIYKPGSRVGFGVKVKPVMETLDLVIVGAEWGEGKRSGWLTSFSLACYDPDSGEFVEIGKMGTGMKELEGEGVSFNQLTELLRPLIESEKGREVTVKPQVVIEVKYEEIQKSPTYSSGYALRFPRLERLRVDKSPEDISDVYLVEQLYDEQRGRNK